MKEPMHNALTEFGACGEFIIDVERIVIPGETCKGGHILTCNGAGNALSLAHFQRVKAVCSAHAHGLAIIPTALPGKAIANAIRNRIDFG